MEALALKYRPRSFGDIVGQKLTAIILDRMVESGSVPHGLLFSGPSGTGKTTAARILAASLNPDSEGDIEAGISLDVTEVDSASNGGVNDVRSLMETLRYSSSSRHRVVIYDEAHSITREGFNALLKPTEEDSGATFIFVTTEPEKIPTTVLSRLIEFQFRSVSIPEVFDRLTYVAAKEEISVDQKLIFDIAQRSGGNIRSALMSLDQVIRAGISSVEEYADLLGDHDTAPTLISALLTGDAANFFGVLDEQLTIVANPAQIASQLVRCLRDLLILRSNGDLQLTGPSLESRKELALRIESERILAAVKILWDLKTRVRMTEDARGNLELALMLVSEVFSRGKTAPSTPPVVAPMAHSAAPTIPVKQGPARKMTLSEIQQRR